MSSNTGGFKKSLVTWNHYIYYTCIELYFENTLCYCTYFHKPIVGRTHIWILQIKKQLAASDMATFRALVLFFLTWLSKALVFYFQTRNSFVESFLRLLGRKLMLAELIRDQLIRKTSDKRKINNIKAQSNWLKIF